MIAIVQPHIPHYRKAFFAGIQNKFNTEIFTYQDKESTLKQHFDVAAINTQHIGSKRWLGFLWYEIKPLLNKKYRILLLLANRKHLTVWLLLVTKFIHKKRIVILGHGISIKNYLEEQQKPSMLFKWMFKLADDVWFYTNIEKNLWSNYVNTDKLVSINNTISDLDKIQENYIKNKGCKELLKKKYQIKNDIILIFCARFDNPYRRTDLLIEVIKKLNNDRFGFIIIGEGKFKPDFDCFSNVYDFKSVYDLEIKAELFTIADVYFQPAWLGLSVVEAMAYHLPVFSFIRSASVLQCVEYAYIKNNVTGKLFSTIEEMIIFLEQKDSSLWKKMGEAAYNWTSINLSMDHMIKTAQERLLKIY